MGVVYQATDLKLDRSVAIKMIRSVTDDPRQQQELTERFFREARVCARIQSSHVVNVFEFGVTDTDEMFIAMEHLVGESLKERISRLEKIPVPTAVIIGAQICLALEAAHAIGVIHRDLKPGNIFLISHDGNPDFVKVLDFGVAKLLDGEDLTRTGMMIGTVDYIAPEQVLGREITPRADIYSLGVLLYRIITGTRMFLEPATIPGFHNVNTRPDPIRLRAPDVDLPKGLEEVIFRCLEKDPAKRYPSMSALREALLPFATNPPLTLPNTTDPGNRGEATTLDDVPATSGLGSTLDFPRPNYGFDVAPEPSFAAPPPSGDSTLVLPRDEAVALHQSERAAPPPPAFEEPVVTAPEERFAPGDLMYSLSEGQTATYFPLPPPKAEPPRASARPTRSPEARPQPPGQPPLQPRAVPPPQSPAQAPAPPLAAPLPRRGGPLALLALLGGTAVVWWLLVLFDVLRD